MKYASIDIGTNTVLMLIVEKNENIREIMDTSTITRLGQGLKQSSFLSKESMDRTHTALKVYRDIIDREGVQHVLCVGTSALREAKNTEEFLKKVEEELGINVRVISEKEEAYYTYLSVINDSSIKCGDCIIADIGGGSTEIIRGGEDGLMDFVSLPVGSVKLTEMFIRNDPPSQQEIFSVKDYIKGILNLPFDGHGCSFIGTGGTITNLAGIIAGIKEYRKDIIHGLTITMEQVENIIEYLKNLSVSERKNIIGLEAGREDIILQGVILLKEVMSYFSFDDMVVSANGVRYGVLFERFKNQNP